VEKDVLQRGEQHRQRPSQEGQGMDVPTAMSTGVLRRDCGWWSGSSGRAPAVKPSTIKKKKKKGTVKERFGRGLIGRAL
jgi:hypothetical protein